MGENVHENGYKTFAVKIVSIKADWILNDENGIGLEFLEAMLKKRNRDIFMTPYM